MADKEYIYSGYGNTIDLVLKADGVAQDLSSITGIRVMFDTTTVWSDAASTGPIKWQSTSDTTWDLGEIRIDCGSHGIENRRYHVPVITYDPSNTDGIMWGRVKIEVEDV